MGAPPAAARPAPPTRPPLSCPATAHPLPRWATLPTSHVVLKLRAAEANDAFFRDFVAVLDGVRAVVATPGHARLAAALLVPVALETGTGLGVKGLAAVCGRAVEAVEAVVHAPRGAHATRARGAVPPLHASPNPFWLFHRSP